MKRALLVWTVWCAGCAPLTTIRIQRGSAEFKQTIGANQTLAWDGLPPVDSTPAGGSTRLIVEGTVPRELVVFDKLQPFPGAPVDPPAIYPTLYASRSGAAPPGTSAAADVPVYARAARVIDHGAAFISVPWVAGKPDGNGVVHLIGADPVVKGSFFGQLADKLYSKVEAMAPDDRNEKVARLGAIYRPWFRQAEGSGAAFNQDGFYLWDKIQFKGLRTVFSVPYTREVVLSGYFRIYAQDGDVHVDPVTVDAGGDVPDSNKTDAKKALSDQLPPNVVSAIHDLATAPLIATCEPKDVACCQRNWPNGLAATLTLAGIPDAESKVLAAGMPQSRVFAPDDGGCKYALRILRVNVLPERFELVLADSDKPLPGEARLACKAGSATCSLPESSTPQAPVLVYVPVGP